MSMIGKSLAHYEITGLIGKGGMGEVYQAKDMKLGRDVAIKVLPEEFARDTERVARFQREAKLLASLNHQNIAGIYGLEESGGTHFLVLELIEGQTLAERIQSGPIPVEEALRLALQIAEALETAHEKGVIHRDLKPANIKITPEGKVKVLDFGLAKAYAGGTEDRNLSNSPTISDMATRQGVILGTSAYMPPEQAKGRSVDTRADIWAFGVVLFEMLTGRQLFTGETVSETLASVIKSEPDWNSLPTGLHPRIRLLLERCLEKEPKNRYGAINDARVDIQKVLSDPGGVFARPAAGAEPAAKSRHTLLWASITAILIIVAIGIVWNLKTKESRQVSYFEFTLPADQEFNLDPWGHPFLTISPDGSQFVYGTTKGMYIRSVDRLDTRRISGSEDNSEAPFFSPDGRWIGFYSPADRKLKKILISGGLPISLCDIPTSLAGMQWRTDRTILLALFPGGIMKIPENGGTPEPLFQTEPAEGEGMPFAPQILPDGKNILFTNFIDANNKQIMVRSLKSGEKTPLFPGQVGFYVPTGHIIYGLTENSGERFYAVPFDLDTLKVAGKASPLPEGISLSLSESGTFAYVPKPETAPQSTNSEAGSADPNARTLWWVDRSGKEEQIQVPPRIYFFPRISPDGTKTALSVALSGNEDIWILDNVRETTQRLTFNEGVDRHASWSPDGKRIAYMASNSPELKSKSHLTGILSIAANGTGKAEYLFSKPDKGLYPYSWTEDGKILLVAEIDEGYRKFDIGMISLGEKPAYTPLLKEDYLEIQPQLSPDGKWLAYTSTESYPDGDGGEVYVRSFPDVDKGGKWPISNDRGSSPRWSADGKELFYLVGGTVAEAVMRVEIKTGPEFSFGNPEVLFRGNYLGSIPNNDIPYDVHPDGKRFLMMKPNQLPTAAPSLRGPRRIVIVRNWFEELKRQAPGD